MRLFTNLAASFKAYHDGRPLLQWLGVVGFLAFPTFFILRQLSWTPPYDDSSLRAAATLLCLGMALRQYWPARLAPFYLPYAYFAVFYGLSFLQSFDMLMNGGGTHSVANMVTCTVVIIILADWRNALVMLLGGYATSIAAHWLLAAEPAVPREFFIAAPCSLLMVIGGAVSHHGQKRSEAARLERLYSGLAASIAHELRNPLAQVSHALDAARNILAPTGVPAAAALTPGQVTTAIANLDQGKQSVARGLQAVQLTLRQLHPGALSADRFRPISAAECVGQAVAEFAYDDEGQ